MTLRVAVFAAWLVALARVVGGALLLWALGAPDWAIAGWLLAVVKIAVRLPRSPGEGA